MKAVAPGLLTILIVDLLAILNLWPTSYYINVGLTLTMLVLPWVSLVILRKSSQTLGYRKGQLIRAVGWGMIAGGVWRILSILINLLGLQLGADLNALVPRVIGAIIWVPLVEETFFRGYLGRALIQARGLWTGIIVQALLFTFHPVHLSQGSFALVSVFGFGILAGWIQHHFNNLWSAWVAHAFANFLPILVEMQLF
jgi:membrane protease YdiL (CAAX protease family)